MSVIYKYPLNLIGVPQTIGMPEGAVVLAIQMQNEDIQMWAMVEPANGVVSREFIVVGTGNNISYPEFTKHLATVQNAGFVWHVFEKGE